MTPLFAQLEAPPGAPETPRAAADLAVAAEGEIYNRGPLHEAFATPTTNDPLQSPVISLAPPELIDEVPPDEQPVGDNIIWIPGYWAFDEELDDFLWVSGLWRDAPPDREWVPGYWVEAEGGYRWVHGMWVSVEVTEIAYLPEPPPSQEQGPSSPAPDDNYFYVPGNWEYHEVDYRWRPGFWAPRQRDWIWVPASYHWSPGGYVYTPGYWDYGLTSRGVVYAPVYFHGGFHGHYYQPVYALNTWEHLLLHLFVQPSYGHYVFGNYYGAGFADRGILPWYQYGRRHRGYDPLFSYYNWRFGDRYVGRLDQWHDYFVRNENYRPRRTLREEIDFARANPDNEIVQRTRLASRIDEFRERQELPVDFREVDETSRERYRDRVKELRDFTQRRREVELAGPTEADVAQPDSDQAREDRGDRRSRRTLELPRRVARDIEDSGLPQAIDQPERPDVTDRPDVNSSDVDRPNADRPDVTGRDREGRTREDRAADTPDQQDRDPIDRRLRDGRIRTPEQPDQMQDIRPDTPDGDEPRIPDRRERDRTRRDLTPDRTFPQVPDADQTPDRTLRPDQTPQPEPAPGRDRGNRPERETPRREADQPSGDRPNRIERETRRIPQPEQQPDRPAVQPRPEQQQPSTDRGSQRRESSAQPDRSNSGSRRGSDQGARPQQRSSERERSSDRGTSNPETRRSNQETRGSSNQGNRSSNSNQGNRGGSNRGDRGNRGDR